MNESDFRKKWTSDKPVYEAWGSHVIDTINKELEDLGKDLDVFFKIPVSYRLKKDDSLIDKAFYRADKEYSDPYNEIEDKVGARMIVLLLDNIEDICTVVKGNEDWDFDECKHFDRDKEKNPLLFTYQSVHYILRPKNEMTVNGVTIPESTPCELQIRTLLQHAHAELTHDAIYKTEGTVQPIVHRTVAKSMALIETTDDFFTEVTKQLNYGPLESLGIINKLDVFYLSLTKIAPFTEKSSIAIWNSFERFIDNDLVNKIQETLTSEEYSFLPEKIIERYKENTFYHQSTILFIYWLLINRKNALLRDWPLSKTLLDPLALDLGINTSED